MNMRAVKFRVGREWRLGALYSPALERRSPAVLLLHGVPGAFKNEDVASELCRRGVAAFTPFFRGCWGSPGEFLPSRLIEDARAALRLLARYRHVDAARLGILGYSAGAWSALRLAAERPVAAVAALAPALPRADRPEHLAYLRRSLKVLRAPPAAEVLADYQAAARADRPEEYVSALAPAPLLVVQGLADALVDPFDAPRLLARARGPRQLLMLPGETHEFQGDRRYVVDTVCDWLEARLRPRVPARPLLRARI